MNTSNILHAVGFFVLAFMLLADYPAWLVLGIAIIGLEFDQALYWTKDFWSWWLKRDTWYDLLLGAAGIGIAYLAFYLLEGIVR